MPPVRIIIKRVLFSLMIGLLIGITINEITFLFLHETARVPKVIELVIPAGTAARVARGEKPPTIPDSMVFVVGDTLVVKNDDSADHELGPLWIPAGASASLSLDAFSPMPTPVHSSQANILASMFTKRLPLARACMEYYIQAYRWGV